MSAMLRRKKVSGKRRAVRLSRVRYACFVSTFAAVSLFSNAASFSERPAFSAS